MGIYVRWRVYLISMITASRHMLNNSYCASIAKLLHGVKLLFRSIGKIVRNKKKKKLCRIKRDYTCVWVLNDNSTACEEWWWFDNIFGVSWRNEDAVRCMTLLSKNFPVKHGCTAVQKEETLVIVIMCAATYFIFSMRWTHQFGVICF